MMFAYGLWFWITLDSLVNQDFVQFTVGCAMVLYTSLFVHHHWSEYGRKR